MAKNDTPVVETTDEELDQVNSEEIETPVVENEPADEPVEDQEEQEPETKKAGEANGPRPKEVKAAEKPLSAAKETNPVGEATRGESLDPYAAGQHIKNPEPDNGLASDEAHH